MQIPTTTSARATLRRTPGKEIQVVTFRAFGRDLALPMDCLRGIHRWQDGQAVPIVARPAELDTPQDVEPFAKTLHIATPTGLKAMPVGAIAEITPTWVERRANTPPCALGTARVGTREVLVLDPARL